MNKDLLKEYLSTKYQGPASFLETVIFPIFGEGNFEDGYETELLDIQPERRRMAEATGICSVKQIGTIYVDVEPLYIFDITVSDRVMMERNRVSIQRLIRAVMDHYSCAFMLFHYEDDIRWDWRFTYCHKSANANESTDSKRYTFLLGPGQSCRTAVDNFLKLYNDRKELKIANIEKAFDVEALSKEFFGKYKEHYAIFVNYMIDPKNGMRQQFIDQNFDHTGLDEQAIKEREEKPIRDYVKRLLGRIVFLHFLQKKGWLGVKANGDWGSGDYDFMYQLFENATDEQKDNFLDDVLEPIFNALNNDRSKDNDCVDTKVNGFGVCRIPYLNGGLFERDKYDEIPTVFPYYFFENLLTFFHQYNFTIDENDPNEAEVGIDPEMLGCIFENLLEDNKDKGAFYTPKEIVQYMCRESLIAYLQTDCDEDKKEAIRQFVTTYDVDCIEDIKDIIDKKLCEVKICDPAIGSGAFPMGLLRELFFCRSAIEPNIVENAADIKKHIIQNSIYGVDIEKGAIDIARLRFWLSIVVDSDKPEQLPNFDYKFMQGNSLIESFMGVDLSEIMCSDVVGKSKKNSGVGTLSFDESASVNDIRELLKGYFCEKNFEKKKNTKKQINEKVKEFIGHKTSGNPTIPQQLDLIDVSSNDQFFLWHTWFADVFNRTSKQGFDIVIGNPPYIDSETMTNLGLQWERKLLQKRFSNLSGNWDIYMAFFELALYLGDIVSFITPDKWLSKPFGEEFRRNQMQKRIYKITRAGNKVFENVKVDAIISFFMPNSLKFQTFQFVNKNKVSLIASENLSNIKSPFYVDFLFSQNSKIIQKIDLIESKLINYAECENACATSDFYKVKALIESNEFPDLNVYYKLINTGTIGKFSNKWSDKDISYGGKYSFPVVKKTLFERELGKTYNKRASRKKIIFKGLNLLDGCLDDNSSIIPGKSTLVICSEDLNLLKLLLGILNSRLPIFYIKEKYTSCSYCGGITFTKDMINNFPLPSISLKNKKEIIELVDTIIRKKMDNQDVFIEENAINQLVYKLYNLTKEEVEIINCL